MRAESPEETEESAEPGYSIGTVAGLTGLDPHTIRAWERRYGAVRPNRSAGGARRYGDRDVARLQLLKALTECGEPIGGVADRSDEDLRARLERLAGHSEAVPAEPARGSLSVQLLAPGLDAQREADPAGLGRLRVVGSAPDLDALLGALARTPADVVVVALRELGPEPLRALRRIRAAAPARLTVVLYEFDAAAELARLARTGARLVRAPLRLAQLARAIEDFLAIEAATVRVPPPAPVALGDAGAEAPRHFDDVQLARLLETTGAVGCECPSQLASLVSSTLAFERYSRGCEDKSPEDALLHRRLAEGSSRIRAQLESLLQHVCRHEGIRL